MQLAILGQNKALGFGKWDGGEAGGLVPGVPVHHQHLETAFQGAKQAHHRKLVLMARALAAWPWRRQPDRLVLSEGG
jgi:hypothetical protein